MSFEQAVVQLEQTNAALQEEVVRFRDAAMGLNAIYPTITEGRQAVGDGKYFSVPGGGAYMRLYRRQGTSAELIAEFPDRAALDNVINQVGSLLDRGVVGGSGALMARGAYGIGAAPETIVDIDDRAYQPGIYAIVPTTVGDSPFSAGSVIIAWRGARVIQIATFESSASPDMFIRVYNSGWGTWKKHYSTSNILGAVSQASGYPSGAIIERGSNSSGEYTKFADGSVFMSRNARPNWTDTSVQYFDYPVALFSTTNSDVFGGFVGTNSPALDGRINHRTVELYGATRTSWYIKTDGAGVNGTGEDYNVSFFAYGRWY